MSDSGGDMPDKSDVRGKKIVDPPAWLPEGWTIEIKTRKSGLTAGMKDKYYTNPVTGCKFRSKDEVLRYLTGKPSNRSSRSRPLESRAIVQIPCTRKYSHSMENSAEWLPTGWITEIKTRKSGAGAGHIYRCYIAPFTGYKFYSKREVLCYLETGITSREVCKRKKRSLNMLSIAKPPHAIKRQKLPNTTARRSLFGSQSLNSDGTTPELIGELHLEVKCSQLTHPDLNQCAEDTELSNLSLENSELPNKMDRNSVVQNKILQKASLESEDRKLPEKGVVLEFANGKQLGVDVPLEPNEKKPSENRVLLEMENSEDGKLSENKDLLEFADKKQLEDGVPLEPKDKNTSENGVPPVLEDETSFENGLERHDAGRARLQACKCRVKMPAILPRRASKRLAALKAKLTPDLAYQPSETDPANTLCVSDAAESTHSGEPSMGEEPVGNLDSEKVFHKDPATPLVLPFGDSWPDPCLEFAFKTLTGAIPVAEDTFSIEDYLQQLGVASQRSGGADHSKPQKC